MVWCYDVKVLMEGIRKTFSWGYNNHRIDNALILSLLW